MITRIEKISSVSGTLVLPGDKSISHRAVMFSSMAEGKSGVINFLDSEDIASTRNCFQQLGAEIKREGDELTIWGCGRNGFRKPQKNLDAGNSGTTARLISGILAAQTFESVLVGDESLSKRPMKRIADPLKKMGADLKLTDEETLPIIFTPSSNFHSLDYTLPVASAQVKSAVLLAGLFNRDYTIVREPFITRDHTENLLGLDVEVENSLRIIRVNENNYPTPKEYIVPSDISSAAFFIVLTLLLKNSEIVIKDILLNETRTGILAVLKLMGADISADNVKNYIGEPFGDLIVKSSELNNISISSEIVPNIIDEIPILSVAGLFAEGKFEIRNAEELRYKESDRINALVENYKRLGVKVENFSDGFSLEGGVANKSTVLDSFGDHRIAMAFAVLSLLTEKEIGIENFDCVKISNPTFVKQLKSISR
ncbi:MAG: 3-phosphoshikimate 1-carboxyvinyltransferase [Bacteroidetes bacterium]|nr:3-phosphoshikimate 1-carboxyvinyltransferase [Bacteroidota bacterium]